MVEWAWAESWYEECTGCKRVELVLLIDGKKVCENCFDAEQSEDRS